VENSRPSPIEKKAMMALNGSFNCTLDDKGRVNFPARLKSGFSGETLIVTRGLEKCLYLFPPEEWKEFQEKLENPSMMSRDWRKLQRLFLGGAVEAEIDKTGRLAIPQSLREYGGLVRELVIMGLGKRIEIWDAAVYKATQEGGADGETMEDIAERAGLLF